MEPSDNTVIDVNGKEHEPIRARGAAEGPMEKIEAQAGKAML